MSWAHVRRREQKLGCRLTSISQPSIRSQGSGRSSDSFRMFADPTHTSFPLQKCKRNPSPHVTLLAFRLRGVILWGLGHGGGGVGGSAAAAGDDSKLSGYHPGCRQKRAAIAEDPQKHV